MKKMRKVVVSERSGLKTVEPTFDPCCPSCGTALSESADGEPPTVCSPAAVYALCQGFRYRKTEALGVFTVDAQNALIGRHVASVGSLNTTRTHPREVIRCAVDDMAQGIVLVHNHPSGSLRASEDDRTFTRRIKEACELMGVCLLDHLLVARGGFVSFKESGWL